MNCDDGLRFRASDDVIVLLTKLLLHLLSNYLTKLRETPSSDCNVVFGICVRRPIAEIHYKVSMETFRSYI